MPGVYRQREGEYDILILNEINNAIDYGKMRPDKVYVICTGRSAATEMREIKHPYSSGITALRGIEY